MIDILSLIQQYAPINLVGKPVRNYKNGIEHHSNCPWCGNNEVLNRWGGKGDDRFIIWSDAGRYYCRVCKRSGDMIQFLRDFESMTYQHACKELDIDPRYASEELHFELPLFMTRNEQPPTKWMESAELFVWRAQRYLWTPGGKRCLDYLHSRGLNDDTLKRARIGFCPDWFSAPLSDWGLSSGMTVDEQEIKIPLGIIIPWFVDGKVWKISVRRPDKTYFQCLGSSDCLYNLDTLQPGQPVFLFESEFDALSAQQEAGDLAAMIATGGSAKGQTSPLRTKLKQASHLLIGFDNDQAGEEGSKFWLKMPNALRWTPWVHDCNELLQQQAILVRMWVECGLRTATTQIELPPEPPAEPEKKKYVPPPSYLQLHPWVKTGDRGLPIQCSQCRKPATRWTTGATPFCAGCYDNQKQLSLAL